MGKILRRLYEYKGIKIIEGTSDERSRECAGKHTTKISVLSFMGYLNGKSVLMMFDFIWNKYFEYKIIKLCSTTMALKKIY